MNLFDWFFSSILQVWYVCIPRSNSESPLDWEITRVDCIRYLCITTKECLHEEQQKWIPQADLDHGHAYVSILLFDCCVVHALKIQTENNISIPWFYKLALQFKHWKVTILAKGGNLIASLCKISYNCTSLWESSHVFHLWSWNLIDQIKFLVQLPCLYFSINNTSSEISRYIFM